jgi:hypothetical protein
MATDAHGAFVFEDVPLGDYTASYAPLGGESKETAPFSLTAQQRSIDLGSLALATVDVVRMEKFEVTSRRETFSNSIDRKVYNVGTDIQGVSGSASDLLQNVPSVQVDIDGNVSLRGDSNVLILIDGKPSTLMSATNRADVLAQMPADSIEKIEVVTNPSARYPVLSISCVWCVSWWRFRPSDSCASCASYGNCRRHPPPPHVSGCIDPAKLFHSAGKDLWFRFRQPILSVCSCLARILLRRSA